MSPAGPGPIPGGKRRASVTQWQCLPEVFISKSGAGNSGTIMRRGPEGPKSTSTRDYVTASEPPTAAHCRSGTAACRRATVNRNTLGITCP
eukprot:752540-Hanusia_phi.AAC.1